MISIYGHIRPHKGNMHQEGCTVQMLDDWQAITLFALKNRELSSFFFFSVSNLNQNKQRHDRMKRKLARNQLLRSLSTSEHWQGTLRRGNPRMAWSEQNKSVSFQDWYNWKNIWFLEFTCTNMFVYIYMYKFWLCIVIQWVSEVITYQDPHFFKPKYLYCSLSLLFTM